VNQLERVLVAEGASIRAALESMTASGKQVALVVDGERRLRGLVTDGDVRKALLRGVALESKVEEVMNRHPVTLETARPVEDETAAALALMRRRSIRHLPVLDATGRLLDLLLLDELTAPEPALPTRAVIMAGGEGRRLRPLTDALPKPLVRIGGKPIVEILIERLRQCGIEDVTIALHHRSAMIREQLGDGARLGVRLDYLEEEAPLGTMGALRLLPRLPGAPFFVVNADILTKCDFRAMWRFHRAQPDAAMTVGVSLHQVEIPYGEFSLRGDRVTRVEEKPLKEYPINAGIYVLDPGAVTLIPEGEYFDATDLIRALLDGGRVVAAHVIREYWLDVGRLHDLEKANRDVAEGLLD
jgi:dTDP-glucose pyrophosphorylase